MKITSLLLLFSIVAFTLSGCLSPRHRATVDVRYFTLGTAGEEERYKTDLKLTQVTLTDYLHTSKVVVRTSPHQIAYQPFDLWGSDLRGAIAERLAGVLQYSESVGQPKPVSIHIIRFEGHLDGRAQVMAKLIDTNGNVVDTFTAETPWTGGQIVDLVEALDRCLLEVARELASH